MLEAIFYIAALALFALSFVPRPVRRRAAEALRELWRFLVMFTVEVVEPRAYRLVTGRDPASREGAGRCGGVLHTPHTPDTGILHRGGVLHTPSPLSTDLHTPVPADSRLPAAENTDPHGGDSTVETGEIAPATPEEVQAIGRALRHNFTSADKTKSGAIKAGWGLSRSGTDPRYKRASQLYDLATKSDESSSRFPELTPARQRVLPKTPRS